MGHDHHSHGLRPATASTAHRRRLALALAVTLTVMLVQVVGSIVSGSVALLADAGHMLSDSGGIALALAATWLASRPATPGRTFGWHRAEILAALVNGLAVGAIGVVVIVEGIRRLAEPPEVDASVMLAAALAGLAANIVAVSLLRSGSKESLNVRGAYLEAFGDLLGSVAVVAAAIVIQTTGLLAADALASIAIGLAILPRAVLLLRDVAVVLLEATPADIDLAQVRAHMEEVPGVVGVHDLHAWTITSGMRALTVHVEVRPHCLEAGTYTALLRELQGCIAGHFDVEHSTLQLEPPSHRDTEPGTHD